MRYPYHILLIGVTDTGSPGHLGPQKDWSLAEHVHRTDHELIFIIKGTLEVQIGSQCLVAKPGNVLVYPSGYPHTEKGIGVLETKFIPFRTTAEIYPILLSDRTGRVNDLLSWMFDLPHTDEAKSVRKSYLEIILFELLQPEPVAADRLVSTIAAYVGERLAEPIELSDLANHVSMSKFHFSRVFQSAAGVSPMRFVTERRIRAAQNLILSTPAPLRAIAQWVGLSNEFNLSRVFRKVTGIPPSKLRET